MNLTADEYKEVSKMNWADIVIGVVLLAIAAFIVWRIAKRKKKGGGCAGCSSCAGCPMHGSCEEEVKK
jgi:hypothetical protein